MSYQQKSSVFSRIGFIALGSILVLFLYHYSHHSSYSLRTRTNRHSNGLKMQASLHRQVQRLTFNITNVEKNFDHFELLQFIPNQLRDECNTPGFNRKINSFLFINVNTKIIGSKYLNFLKQLVNSSTSQKLQNKDCLNFRIFILKSQSLLIFNEIRLVRQYIEQIRETLITISDLTQKKIDILTSQQGSIFMLESLITFTNQDQSQTLFKKIDKLVLINLYNSDTKMLEQPSFIYLSKIKQNIVSNDYTLHQFNNLNIIMINTLKNQYQIQQKIKSKSDILNKKHINKNSLSYTQTNNQSLIIYANRKNQYLQKNNFLFENLKHQTCQEKDFINNFDINGEFNSFSMNEYLSICQSKYLTLNNSYFFHTKEIHTLHNYMLNGDYFDHGPFLKLISKFFKENSIQQMNPQNMQYFFRYGETYARFPFQFVQKNDVKKCILHQLQTAQPVIWNIDQECFKLNISTSIQDKIYIISSDTGHFQMYSSSLNKIEPYEENQRGRTFIFEKIGQELIVYNPNRIVIHVTVGQIFSPSSPLKGIFSQFQILYLDNHRNDKQHNQVSSISINKFIVRSCPGDLLIFPDHFPVGKINRQFLLSESTQNCYVQTGDYQRLLQGPFQNWIIFRNILFFTLLFWYAKQESLSKNLFTLLIVNFLILYYTNFTSFQNLIILFVSYAFQRILTYLSELSGNIQIDRNKIYVCMLVIFFIAALCEGFMFHHFNYWKMLLIFIIFFVNKENSVILFIKLYFLIDLIFYGQNDSFQIIQLVLFLFCNPRADTYHIDYMKINRSNRKMLDILEEMMKIIALVIAAIMTVINPFTGNIRILIDYFIRIKIVITILKKIF